MEHAEIRCHTTCGFTWPTSPSDKDSECFERGESEHECIREKGHDDKHFCAKTGCYAER
jgi:hypothetical protein